MKAYSIRYSLSKFLTEGERLLKDILNFGAQRNNSYYLTQYAVCFVPIVRIQ